MAGEDDRVVVGTIVSVHGLKGKLKVYPASETLERFSAGETFWLRGKDKETRSYRIAGAESFTRCTLLSIEGITKADQAKELVGSAILVEKWRFKDLPAGEYYWFEIIGLKVYSDDGELLGEVKEILTSGGNDVYVVKDAVREYLIPATASVIKRIDLKNGLMVIHILEGLI
jgi:16S rRNA processing protein RimM